MDTTPLLQALGSGLLALLGGFFGASLSRRTEYEKWLRQERSKAFADLLRELHDTRLAAADAMYDLSLTEAERSTKATELYAQLRKFESVARLYMSEQGRVILTKHLNLVWLNTTSKGGPADMQAEIRLSMNMIQSLLETELHQGPSFLGQRPG